MDRIEALGNQISQISMYDIKSMYNQVGLAGSGLAFRRLLNVSAQAKNMVLNVSEMEAKVRDATNDDPWLA